MNKKMHNNFSVASKSISFLLLFLFLLHKTTSSQTNYCFFVDPFIGTGGHGHTFPGPVVPFGMIQPSPDTRLSGWDGCSGYHYSDKKVYGFSHTHLSGTGASDYADILLMPTIGKPKFKNTQYASPFSKENEKASPGYYSVFLEKPMVKVELTASTRCGLHKYTFSKSEQSNVILDLVHRDRVKSSEIHIIGDREIAGSRISENWANNQMLYFVIQFSKPFQSFGIQNAGVLSNSRDANGIALKSYVQFKTNESEVIYARIGISAVSIEGARKNLEAEMPDFNFERVKTAAEQLWNKELSKINIETESNADKRTFYTSFYHCMIAPNMYQDVDGSYRGRDFNVHKVDFNYYTVFSLWDTYRALHPLLTITDKKRTADFINTFIKQFEEGGRLPVWELSSCETWCMIGYHAIPVITEAYLKGVQGFDINKAYEAMKFSAMEDKNALKSYKENGYIKYIGNDQSISRTLEYAYDDWCIAQVALKLNKKEDYDYFMNRAMSYKNIFDSSTGFMRPRSGDFLIPFDPYNVDHNYTEGNAWQYSFYVPHDLSGHIKLLGGKEKMGIFLDSLFYTSPKLTGRKLPDITGLIGQYAHGNEPSHQIAYEYNYCGQAWKTQHRVRNIMKTMYRDKPDGLSGNEDCGQMSAWYVLSALGFYPVCPGHPQYAIGSPIIKSGSIQLENGKSFTIKTENGSDENVYIQSATYNGLPYNNSYITYDQILEGGTFVFKMGNQPNKDWGCKDGETPATP